MLLKLVQALSCSVSEVPNLMKKNSRDPPPEVAVEAEVAEVAAVEIEVSKIVHPVRHLPARLAEREEEL